MKQNIVIVNENDFNDHILDMKNNPSAYEFKVCEVSEKLYSNIRTPPDKLWIFVYRLMENNKYIAEVIFLSHIFKGELEFEILYNVEPNSRNKGKGGLVVNLAIAQFIKDIYRLTPFPSVRMVIYVDVDNTPSNKIARNIGFNIREKITDPNTGKINNVYQCKYTYDTK